MTQLPLSQTSTERYTSVPVVLFKDNEWSRETLCLLRPSEQFASLKPKIIEGVKASANSDVRYAFSVHIHENRHAPRYVVNALTNPLDDGKTLNYYPELIGGNRCTIIVVDHPTHSKTIIPDTTSALSGNDKVELRPSNIDDTPINLRVHKKLSAGESVAQFQELENEIRDLNEKVRDFVRIEAFLECKKKYAKACEAIHNIPAKYLASISADYGGGSPKVPSKETMDLVANAIQDTKAKVEMLSAVSEYKLLMARSDALWEKLSQYAKDGQLDLAHWGL